MTTRAQLENTIRSLNSCDHLAPDEATRLRSAIKELEALTGARVTVSGECISLDVTRNRSARNVSPVRATYCPKCKTSGTGTSLDGNGIRPVDPPASVLLEPSRRRD